MKARLGFGMSMGIAFDWYLVDELTAVGDSRFKKKSLALFRARLQDAGLLMVSHSINTIRTYCTSGPRARGRPRHLLPRRRRGGRGARAQHGRRLSRRPSRPYSAMMLSGTAW